MDVYLGNEVIIESKKGRLLFLRVNIFFPVWFVLACLIVTVLIVHFAKVFQVCHSLLFLFQHDFTVYCTMVGSLLYVAQWTRPDISYLVPELFRVASNPRKVHLEQAERVLCYLSKPSSLHAL